MDDCKDDMSDEASDGASAGDEDWFGDFRGLVCLADRLPPEAQHDSLVNCSGERGLCAVHGQHCVEWHLPLSTATDALEWRLRRLERLCGQ
jgi:hypothetical protein